MLACPRIAKVTRRGALAISAALITACGGHAEEARLPDKWAIDYKHKPIGQIIREIGTPQEAATAKQFMNWVDSTPNGRRVLKLVCRVDCSANEIPAGIIFLVYRNGTVEPLRAQTLL